MIIVVSLLLIVAIAILKYVKDIADETRAVRDQDMPRLLSAVLRLPAYRQTPPIAMLGHDQHYRAAPCAGAFVHWIWSAGDWCVLDAPAGIEPGLAPNYPGTFDGDTVKSWIPSQR